MDRLRTSVEERLFSRVVSSGKFDCWVWTGGTITKGYGHMGASPRWKTKKVHRISYELLIEPIPAGLQIDHLCNNPPCINPGHLEVVDARTNILRGNGSAAQRARQTHCKRGHRFTQENTYITPSRENRICRICQKRYRRKRYLRESRCNTTPSPAPGAAAR